MWRREEREEAEQSGALFQLLRRRCLLGHANVPAAALKVQLPRVLVLVPTSRGREVEARVRAVQAHRAHPGQAFVRHHLQRHAAARVLAVAEVDDRDVRVLRVVVRVGVGHGQRDGGDGGRGEHAQHAGCLALVSCWC